MEVKLPPCMSHSPMMPEGKTKPAIRCAARDSGLSICQKVSRLVGKTPIFSNEVFF